MSNEVQLVSSANIANWSIAWGGGQPGIQYVRNIPPYDAFVWNGLKLVGASTVDVYTFASLPDPTTYIGTAYVTDIGLHGSFWRSDGATWGIVGGVAEYAHSAVAQTAVTGTTALTTIVTIPVAGGLMGLNGAFEVVTKWSMTNNANAKTAYVYLGSSVATGIGMPSSLTFGCRALLENRSSQSSQINSNGSSHGFASSAAAWTVSAVDTSVATSISIRMQLGVGTDSATLESYSVLLRRP